MTKSRKEQVCLEDSPSVAKAGHRLKGVAGNYGLLSLHQQACLLEQAARNGDQAMMQISGLKLESLTDSCISRLG
jgi:HPt (histidine-containing phosphotransfer) domain-containing protein